MTAIPTTPHETRLLPIHAADGARVELMLDLPGQPTCGLLWIPALGMSARQYQPLARALNAQGIAVARHEWRGLGSSSLRAGRGSNWTYRELLADIDDSLAAARAATPGLRWIVAGHSLGSQFAAMAFALHPEALDGFAVVAGGTPYWRNFPGATGLAIRTLFAIAPAVGKLRGHFPGRRLRFAGNEARGVIRDWARSGLSGRYAPRDVAIDIEAAFARRRGPVLGVWPDDDWLTPRASFEHLLGKFPQADVARVTLTADDFVGIRADHFGWLKQPAPIADAIGDWSRQSLPRMADASP